MAIHAECPHCGHSFRRHDGLAGKKEKCPKCKMVMRMPSAEQGLPGKQNEPVHSPQRVRSQMTSEHQAAAVSTTGFVCPICSQNIEDDDGRVGAPFSCPSCSANLSFPPASGDWIPVAGSLAELVSATNRPRAVEGIGKTLADARLAAFAQLDLNPGDVVEETVLSDGSTEHREFVGNTQDEAMSSVQATVSSKAICHTRLLQDASEAKITVDAYSGKQAIEQGLGLRIGPRLGKAVAVSIEVAGKRGFLRVGRRKSRYSVLISAPAIVTATWAQPAMVRLNVEFDGQFAETLKGLSNPKWAERKNTAVHLISYGGYRALWGHARLLGDDDSSTAQVIDAKHALREAGDLAVEPLCSAIWDHPQVYTAAAKELGRMGTRVAIWGLANSLHIFGGYDAKPNYEVVGEELIKIGVRGVPALAHSLLYGHNEGRDRAAEILGRIRSETAILHLTQALKDHSFEEAFLVRRSAAEALGGFGKAAAIATPLLVKMLEDPDPTGWAPKCAQDALKKIGTSAVPHLIDLLSDAKTRMRALDILEHLDVRNAALTEQLLDMWREPNMRNTTLLHYLLRAAPTKQDRILGDALLGPSDLAAEAVKALREMEPEHHETVNKLDANIRTALETIMDDIRDEVQKEDNVQCASVFRIAFFGTLATHVVPQVEELHSSAKHPHVATWLTAALACIADDPGPYLYKLLQPMKSADVGHAHNAAARQMQSMGAMPGLSEAIGYVAAWSAGSPAMTAQKALEEALTTAGPRILPALSKLRHDFPSQVKKVLEKTSSERSRANASGRAEVDGETEFPQVLEFRCVNCGHEFRRPASLAGHRDRCPECRRVIVLPRNH